ncbi:MAG: hypothetical protein ACWGQW_04265 [bacterium]
MSSFEQTNPLWDDDAIQFPRLISEIAANVQFTNDDWDLLLDSMDLDELDILELFDRADFAWEAVRFFLDN